MHSEHSPQAKDKLQAVSDAFDEWRRSREKRGPIPDDLWRAAGNLSPYYSTYEIARALKLDYARLKRRIGETWLRDNGARFIELKAEDLFAAGSCVIRLQSPGGFQMEICAEGAMASALSPLVAMFLAQSS